jgi:hypothetical protein
MKMQNNPNNLQEQFQQLQSATSIMEFISMRENLSLQTNTDIINNIIYEYDKFKLELHEKGTEILL